MTRLIIIMTECEFLKVWEDLGFLFSYCLMLSSVQKIPCNTTVLRVLNYIAFDVIYLKTECNPNQFHIEKLCMFLLYK